MQQNITMEECVTVHNCTLCLHDHFVECTKEGTETCSDIAVKVCIQLWNIKTKRCVDGMVQQNVTEGLVSHFLKI